MVPVLSTTSVLMKIDKLSRRETIVDAIGTYNWIMNKKDFIILKTLIVEKFKADYTHNIEVPDLPLTHEH